MSRSSYSSAARWWAQRPPREQQLLVIAAVLVTAALLWTVALAPALRTVLAYPAQRAALDAQLQSMQVMQARAQALKGQPGLDGRAAQAALQAAVESLGPRGRLLLANQQATVTLKSVDAPALAQWLARVRNEAHLTPQQAQLQRDGKDWSGSMQFKLPGN